MGFPLGSIHMGTKKLLTRASTELFRIEGIDAEDVVAIGIVTVTVVAAELLVYFGAVRTTLLLYLLTFVSLLLLPIGIGAVPDLFRAFALVPLFRLVNLGMPVFVETTLGWLGIVYLCLVIATAVTAATLSTARFVTVDDLRRLLLYSPLVGGVALAFGAAEYAVLRPDPLVSSLIGFEGVLFVVVMIVFVSLGEEFLFRGVIQSTVADHVGPGLAVAVSALLFGVLHSGFEVPGAVGWTAFTAVVFSLYYQLSANWLVTGVLRGIANVLVYGVFPVWGSLPVLLG